MSNPFETLESRLNRIENILLDLQESTHQKPKRPKMYSIKEMAKYSGASENTVRNWINEGKVKAKRIGGRIFIEEEEFQKALSEVKSLKYQRA
ncbi:MAG: helix-turn-helix domain-containing protein [Christiangramia sp.]|uniref:helix-turn-helix domain-containing protein n=1 Tax=Christiangramia sp. TaxID=1931228 RepID=UPI00324294B1